VKTLFFGAKAANENVASLLVRSLIPFPRMHFFTLATAMGQELEDGSILGVSITMNADTVKGSGIPASKFLSNVVTPKGVKKTMFTMRDPNGDALYDRALIATEGTETAATIIQNGSFLRKLLTGLLGPQNEDCEFEEFRAYFTEKGVDDVVELEQMESNSSDLISEFKQYMEVAGADDSDEE
jgi:hypothetical protein